MITPTWAVYRVKDGICSKTLSKCINYERNRHFAEYYYKHSISKYNKKDEICVKSRPFFFVCFCVFPLKIVFYRSVKLLRMSRSVNRIASRRAGLVLHVTERRQQIDCDKAENHQ